MNTNEHEFKHGEITKKFIGVFYDVYNDLGYGFLESVYQKALGLALNAAGLKVCAPIKISVWFRGTQVGYFEGDMLVENCVLLELKATRALESSHQAQLLNYLRATDVEVGLLLNYGPKPEFKRLLFDNSRKANRGRN
jgi:GxxExxY protein